MNYWSEGLGKQELVIGLDRAKLVRKGDKIVLTGIVDAPAPWEYEVTMQASDWVCILNTATSKGACQFIAAAMGVGAMKMAPAVLKFIVTLALLRGRRMLGFGRGAAQASVEPPAKTPDRSALHTL